ncbi:three component ABC system middle component [Marichromatium gracile]|uniref:three component ABC system middle component n=1 Tax=Marichromatium gracile TaxID=1048 RepID=UPI00398C35BA
MTWWKDRSPEERTLLNPGYCANLLWHAARGHVSYDGSALAFEEAFLVLPLVLDRRIRENLPRDTRTSLATWLEGDTLARGRVALRAQLLAEFTKDALMFGGIHGLLSISEGKIVGVDTWRKAIRKSLRDSSEEVRETAKRAEFVGKWFAHAGAAATVLALIGVRP